MRYSLLILFILLFTDTSEAQRASAPRVAGVWFETSIGRNGNLLNPNRQPRRSTLILDRNGFFEEIRAGRSRRSSEVIFSGRWDIDYRRGWLNLALDQGVVGNNGYGRNWNACPPPGRSRTRGRDVIRYEIVYNDRDELVLRDRRTGRKRAFIREQQRSRNDYYRRQVTRGLGSYRVVAPKPFIYALGLQDEDCPSATELLVKTSAFFCPVLWGQPWQM